MLNIIPLREEHLEDAAQLVIAERFDDAELNALPFRDVETVLALRFMRRLPDARSAPARLERHIPFDVPRGKVIAQELLPTVNQPGQHPSHSCL